MKRLAPLIILLILSSLVSARMLVIQPETDEIDILIETNEFITLIPLGIPRFEFTENTCVSLAQVFDDWAEYRAQPPGGVTCETEITDSGIPTHTTDVNWFVYDYVCDGCTQWTDDALESDDISLSIIEVPTGSGIEDPDE